MINVYGVGRVKGNRLGAVVLASFLGVLLWFGAPGLMVAQEEPAVGTVEVVENETVFPETPQGDAWTLPTPMLVALVVGFLLPPIQAAVQKPSADPLVKSLVMLGIAVVSTFVQLWSMGHLGGSLEDGDFLRVALITIVASQGSYRAFWKPSTATTRIEAHTPGLI